MIRSCSQISPAPLCESYDILGNVPLDAADVILVTDDPTDSLNFSHKASLIERIWNHHHLLIEQIPTGVEVSIEELKRFVGVNLQTEGRGWDIPDIQGVVSELAIEEADLACLVSKIHKSLAAEDRESFLNDLLPKILKFAPETQKKEREIFAMLENCFTKAFSHRMRSLVVEVYRAHREKVSTQYRSLFQKRLASLRSAIEEGISLKRKFIVSLSGNFVIPNPRLRSNDFRIDDFQVFLNKMKYVVINPKTSPLKMEKNQPTLWLKVPKTLLQQPVLRPLCVPIAQKCGFKGQFSSSEPDPIKTKA